MNDRGDGEEWVNLRDLGGKHIGSGDKTQRSEREGGMEGDAQVSSLQTWREGVLFMVIRKSGTMGWWGVDYSLGHDHVGF